ncbi:MAG TPA: cytochrome b/b6 domain-containing protein [Jatrophihabitans sp.]|jgi:formate dehydrogenase subunit gamma|nr:cytochrome b/b6 domain-containing protein [Jatrophihabitans sp.]
MAATARSGQLGANPDWVHRFGLTERFGHWWTVSMLAVAALSGLALGDDGSGPMLVVHVAAVVALTVGALVIVIFGDRRSLVRAATALLRLDHTDRQWLAGRIRHPLHRQPEPQWGMFNAGQKMMAWALAGSVTGLIGSGLHALFDDAAGGLHAAFALLTGALVGAHVFMAVINPATRHALNAMVHGRVRRSWAAQHHPKWLSSIGH